VLREGEEDDGVYGFVFWLFVYGVRGLWARGGLVVVEYAVARAAREIKGFEGLKMEGFGLCGSNSLG